MESTLPSFDFAKYILPEDIFKYFCLRQVEEAPDTLHFHFDELNILPEEYLNEDMESKGFHQTCVIKDFPLREKKEIRNIGVVDKIEAVFL